MSAPSRRIEALWDADGFGARALTPFSWVFGAATALRNLAYDRGVLATHALGLPTVSVGNLTVGGTGKTPMSAWTAQRLLALGARPGILLRGYGDDEPIVHRRLTSDAVVVADADRVRGALTARAQGARVLVLDDAFQYRRARRDVDLVLVSAEQSAAHRLLPAGRLRESSHALQRAHGIVITRKSASQADAERAVTRWGAANAALPIAIAALHPAALVRAGEHDGVRDGVRDGAGARGLNALEGAAVLAISAIGAPRAFEEQLTALGARVTSAAFPDHHPFSDAEVTELAHRSEGAGMAVCTLKDAVKLEGRWPRQAPPLWYLSQAVTIERGGAWLDALLSRLAAATTP